MMRSMKLLTVALVGTSTLALAQPDPRWTEHRAGDRYDEHRNNDHDRDDYRVPRDQWTSFATRVKLEGRGAPRVVMNDARIRSIELQASRGSANIDMVAVVYSDGTQGAIRINRSLDARSAPNLRFDVPDGRRGVHAIVIEGTGDVRFRVIGG